CSALIKNGHNIKLYVWKNKNKKLIKKNYEKILKLFDLNYNFEIKNYPSISPFGNSLFSSYYLSKMLDYTNIDFIIARNLRACFFSSNKCYVYYETHKPFKYYNFIDRIFYKILVSKKMFLSLITISDFLINDYNKIKIFKNIRKLKLRDGSNTNEHIISNSNGQSLNVGYIGSLYEGRGIEIIIKLSQLMKHISFNIVGGNDLEIKTFKKKYECSNIIFYGHLDYISSIKQMKNFDILLAPYQSNTTVPGAINTSQWMSPIKLFEYMSAKKPIITSDIKSLKEFMKDKYNCIMVKENNIIEWQKAIQLIIDDKKLANNIVENAFTELKLKYTWDIRAKLIVKNFINIHKEN
ncbi:glycosyltransferase, partial [Alphaproteobacteria bacterium]|nr:glycosyltransferase [Alphaproteobacteria bacterium]